MTIEEVHSAPRAVALGEAALVAVTSAMLAVPRVAAAVGGRHVPGGVQ